MNEKRLCVADRKSSALFQTDINCDDCKKGFVSSSWFIASCIVISCCLVLHTAALFIDFNQSISQSLFSPFSDFLQQYYSNSLGAGALNKPFWAYKESPWYINLLINYSEFT